MKSCVAMYFKWSTWPMMDTSAVCSKTFDTLLTPEKSYLTRDSYYQAQFYLPSYLTFIYLISTQSAHSINFGKQANFMIMAWRAKFDLNFGFLSHSQVYKKHVLLSKHSFGGFGRWWNPTLVHSQELRSLERNLQLDNKLLCISKHECIICFLTSEYHSCYSVAQGAKAPEVLKVHN